jgi:hypothetical protein
MQSANAWSHRSISAAVDTATNTKPITNGKIVSVRGENHLHRRSQRSRRQSVGCKDVKGRRLEQPLDRYSGQMVLKDGSSL